MMPPAGAVPDDTPWPNPPLLPSISAITMPSPGVSAPRLASPHHAPPPPPVPALRSDTPPDFAPPPPSFEAPQEPAIMPSQSVRLYPHPQPDAPALLTRTAPAALPTRLYPTAAAAAAPPRPAENELRPSAAAAAAPPRPAENELRPSEKELLRADAPRPKPPPAQPQPEPVPAQLTDSRSTLQDSTEVIDSHSPTVIDPARLEVNFDDKDARIGIGTYGAVYIGRYFGELVAVKRVRIPDSSPAAARDDPHLQQRRDEALRQFAREIRRYERVSHPGIVRFLGVTLPPDSSALLVTELMHGGSLGAAVGAMRRARIPMHTSSVVRVALQACGGLRALHAARCTWGDGKPENVLLSAPLEPNGEFPACAEARIADFGLSRSVGQSLLGDTTLSGTGQPAGTYNYMAPEAFTGIDDDNDKLAKAADIYSFGLIVYEMLTLRTPWRRRQMMDVLSAVMEGRRPAWPTLADDDFHGPVPPRLRALVERCWAQNPLERPTADQVFEELNAYSLSLTKGGTQRPVTDIASAAQPPDGAPYGRWNNGMPRVLSKQSNVSTVVAICESAHASVDLHSPGLESTRESVRYADASDDENALYDSITGTTAQPASGPRVSPVTSPEPRSLNTAPNSLNAVSARDQQQQGLRDRAIPPPTRSLLGTDQHQVEQHMRLTGGGGSLGPVESLHVVYRKDGASAVGETLRAEATLEHALRRSIERQESPRNDDTDILDHFSHADLQHVPTTDFLKHRDEIALATAQAAAQLSRVDNPEDSRSLQDRDRGPQAPADNPALTQSVAGNTLDGNHDLTSSTASTASLRRKRSKRLQSIIEHAALAFMEIRRREEASSKMPPKQRKELADRKALEEAKLMSEQDSLKAIENARQTGDFSIVLEEMKMHRHSHAVAKAGCVYLSSYCKDENLYFDVCEEGGVEEMVSAAALHGAIDPALSITFCNSMTALCEHYDDKVGNLMRGVGVPSQVIELLEEHKTDIALQTAGCESLAVIASTGELSRSAVATLGGPRVVYQAMSKNNTSFRDVGLAKAALKAVRQIAQDNERAAEFLVEVAALDTVSRASEVFSDHGLEADILAALRAFAFYNRGRRHIIMSSGLKALTAIMSRNREPDFSVQCCTFIRAIARWRDLECEEAMLQSSISEQITDLMRMSNDIPGEEGARVAWYASHACTFLASFGPRSRRRLRRVGAIETSIGVLNNRKENARVVHSATDALAELIKGDAEAKACAEKANAFPSLTEALELHSNIIRVRNALQWTLDYLSSSKESIPGPAYGSRVYNELMDNKNNSIANNEEGGPHGIGTFQTQAKPARRFLGFNFGRRKT